MRRICAPVALAALLALIGQAAAGPLDSIYDDEELEPLRASFQSGWLDNYDNLFGPLLSAEERVRLADVDFRVDLRVPEMEPFAYMAGGNTVIVSAASLHFLEDITMAYTWLNGHGLSTQSLADYLLMLRYWGDDKGRPPKPWAVLCIPDNAFDEQPYGDNATRIFDSAVVFALLHEYGHVYYRHPGNRAVAPDVSRANEEAADAFALELFARAGQMPLGVTVLFFMMANLQDNRADFRNDAEYERTLAARTHPVSPDRLQSVARNLAANAAVYGKNLTTGGPAKAVAISLELSQFALLLADPGIQQLSARFGETATPEDLGPRARGRNLAAPCGQPASGGMPFAGTLHGKVTGGSTALNLDVVLKRDGDRVRGSYSYGGGFGRVDGVVTGDTLGYRWTLPPDSGGATLTLKNGVYRGTWGMGAATTGAGTIVVEPE